MPLPGDQHRDTPATTNPFHETKPHISEYTAKQVATLQSRLDKQLGPEYISTRPGAGGGKVHYLAAEKVINLANEVLGFNGWSSAIQNVQIDFVDENPANGKVTLGLSTIVRVSLKDGTFHEDIGYGHIENCKGKAAAFEKAKKEAATDAMKRALRNFGNVLGNCLYDKDYLQKVSKLKVAPSRWDPNNLHRHPDYAPIKRESIAEADAQHEKGSATRRQSSAQSGGSIGSAEFEDDFGGGLLNEEDFTHPDEVRLEDTTMSGIESPAHRAINGPQGGAQRQGMSRMKSMPQLRPPNVQPPAPPQSLQAPQKPQGVQRPPHGAGQPPPGRTLPNQQQQQPQQTGPPRAPYPNAPPHAQDIPPQQPPQQQHNPPPERAHSDTSGPRSNPSSATTVADTPSVGINQTHNPDEQVADEQNLALPPGVPTGFMTGRGANLLNQPPDVRPPSAAIAFNPHADSPSIRRTHGVNPGKSAPITRSAINGNGPAQQHPAPGGGNGTSGATTPVRTNFVNPAADLNRRIGAPMGGVGGMQNRGQYRPPTAVGVKRPALADVSNNANLPQTDGAADSKKAKVEPAPAGKGGDAVAL